MSIYIDRVRLKQFDIDRYKLKQVDINRLKLVQFDIDRFGKKEVHMYMYRQIKTGIA